MLLTHLIPAMTLGEICLRFIGEETEAQRGRVMFPQLVIGRVGIQTQAVWLQTRPSAASPTCKPNPGPLPSAKPTARFKESGKARMSA